MTWPEATDFNEAIQNPATCFHDEDLRRGQPTVNALGLPILCSGNFAAVYQITGPDGRAWAVKCFTREVRGLRERYQVISAHLTQARLPFTVDFQYLEKGILIRGQWYAVVKMRWVEGLTLNQFLKDHADKPQILERLAQLWLKLAQQLRRADIGHADLQHGNVLLVPSTKTSVLSVRLIDYDGMWVPALADSPSSELGHVNYQHPQRAKQKVWDADLDRFSHLVIYAALRALMVGGSGLWNRYDNGENLLFREQDLREPATSPLLHELWKLPDPGLHTLVKRLIVATAGSVADIPTLADLIGESEPKSYGLVESERLGSKGAKENSGAHSAQKWQQGRDTSGGMPASPSYRRAGARPRKTKPATWRWLIGGGLALVLLIGCLGGGGLLLFNLDSLFSVDSSPTMRPLDPKAVVQKGGVRRKKPRGASRAARGKHCRAYSHQRRDRCRGQVRCCPHQSGCRGFQGPIELEVFEQMEGVAGVVAPPGKDQPAEMAEHKITVLRPITIPAAKNSVEVKISAGKELDSDVRQYVVCLANVAGFGRGGAQGGNNGPLPRPLDDTQRTFTLIIQGTLRRLPNVLAVAGDKDLQINEPPRACWATPSTWPNKAIWFTRTK